MNRIEALIIEHAVACAHEAIVEGFWSVADIVDPDSYVEATIPRRAKYEALELSLEREPNDSEYELWLGTWRAVLRDERPGQ